MRRGGAWGRASMGERAGLQRTEAEDQRPILGCGGWRRVPGEESYSRGTALPPLTHTTNQTSRPRPVTMLRSCRWNEPKLKRSWKLNEGRANCLYIYIGFIRM